MSGSSSMMTRGPLTVPHVPVRSRWNGPTALSGIHSHCTGRWQAQKVIRFTLQRILQDYVEAPAGCPAETNMRWKTAVLSLGPGSGAGLPQNPFSATPDVARISVSPYRVPETRRVSPRTWVQTRSVSTGSSTICAWKRQPLLESGDPEIAGQGDGDCHQDGSQDEMDDGGEGNHLPLDLAPHREKV